MGSVSQRDDPFGLQPGHILDSLIESGAAVGREVPLDRAGRNVADVVAFLGGTVCVFEVKPHRAKARDMLQIDRYVAAAMRLWPDLQVYGFLVAPEFAPDVHPHGHVFLQRWPE